MSWPEAPPDVCARPDTLTHLNPSLSSHFLCDCDSQDPALPHTPQFSSPRMLAFRADESKPSGQRLEPVFSSPARRTSAFHSCWAHSVPPPPRQEPYVCLAGLPLQLHVGSPIAALFLSTWNRMQLTVRATLHAGDHSL